MKITAQEEYGLRCLLQLASAPVEGGLTVKEIAGREGLSPAYVEKLLRKLGKAGLIHSIRGAKGGFRLNHPPEELSLGVVVRALGSVPTTGEICDRFTGSRSSCVHIDNCCIRSAWATLTAALQGFLDRTFLSDLIGPEAEATDILARRMEPTRIHFVPKEQEKDKT